MPRALLALVVLWLAPVSARGQEPTMPPPVDAEVAEDEVIRWAAGEVARSEGRPPSRHPPLPPEPYLGHGGEHLLVMPSDDPEPELRVLAELGGGLLGALVGGGLGALLVWAVEQGGAAPDARAFTIGIGGVLSALAITSGVTLGAELRAGRGNFGHAFLGQIVGSLLALPLAVLGFSNDLVGIGVATGLVLPIAGAVIGYEIGHAGGAPRVAPRL